MESLYAKANKQNADNRHASNKKNKKVCFTQLIIKLSTGTYTFLSMTNQGKYGKYGSDHPYVDASLVKRESGYELMCWTSLIAA